MVRLRLRRVGAKKQPSYRVVAADKESPRDGRFIENLGFYNPRTEPATIELKEERIYDWMSKGAQMSDAAEKVFRSAGLLDRYERFKGGESVEVLIQEAKEAEAARNINPKTQRQAPAKAGKKTKAEPQDEPAAAEAEKIDEAVEDTSEAEVEEEAAEVLEEQVESEQGEEEETIIEDKPEDALDKKPADEPESDDEAGAEPVEESEEENLQEEPPAEDSDAEEQQEPEESEVEPGQSE